MRKVRSFRAKGVAQQRARLRVLARSEVVEALCARRLGERAQRGGALLVGSSALLRRQPLRELVAQRHAVLRDERGGSGVRARGGEDGGGGGVVAARASALREVEEGGAGDAGGRGGGGVGNEGSERGVALRAAGQRDCQCALLQAAACTVRARQRRRTASA
jgi:hypothetical protein